MKSESNNEEKIVKINETIDDFIKKNEEQLDDQIKSSPVISTTNSIINLQESDSKNNFFRQKLKLIIVISITIFALLLIVAVVIGVVVALACKE